MKKFFVIFLSLVCVLCAVGFAACGNGESPADNGTVVNNGNDNQAGGNSDEENQILTLEGNSFIVNKAEGAPLYLDSELTFMAEGEWVWSIFGADVVFSLYGTYEQNGENVTFIMAGNIQSGNKTENPEAADTPFTVEISANDIIITGSDGASNVRFTATKVPEAGDGEIITIDKLIEMYNARKDSPYYRLDFIYGNEMTDMEMHPGVANRKYGSWVIVEDPDDMGWSSSLINNMIVHNGDLNMFTDVPEGGELLIKKFTDGTTKLYAKTTNGTNEHEITVIFDRYFNMLDQIQKDNGNTTVEFHNIWSVAK